MGVALAIALAAFVAAHVSIVATLAARRPRWRALAALFVLPLAPWWGWQGRMRGLAWLAIAWMAALGVYAGLVIVAGY